MDDLKQLAASNISARIAEYVERNNTTKEAVAKRIGCSRTAFYQKVNGNSAFTIYEGYQLSELLGCSVSDFFEAQAAS